MNILMMTNTYLPHTGGVARSVAWFSEAFLAAGHRVLVVAPTFDGDDVDESPVDVFRVPAIQNFNGSDFSVRLPVPGLLTAALDDFRPDIVHSHHPFLLGDAALRVSAIRDLPIVFTHHTMYEQYTHYVPGDSSAMQRFAIRLATEYANLCDHVIAPSESIAAVLRKRGVEVPIASIPTGIDKEKFARGDGLAARRRYNIPAHSFVVGHVGRLAEEKNLAFLADAVIRFMKSHQDARFLLVGMGPFADSMTTMFEQAGLIDRVHHPSGYLNGQTLADAYHAMNVFAFASKSETQGMVLAEAMTAGIPVVALDAPGAREVVSDEQNGRLLIDQDAEQFAEALEWIARGDESLSEQLRASALSTADQFSMPRCSRRLLSVYEDILAVKRRSSPDESGLSAVLRLLEDEWNIWAGRTSAASDALFGTEMEQVTPTGRQL